MTETQAARDVLAERERQKTVEGWSVEHDDEYVNAELAKAASSYAYIPEGHREWVVPTYWPWAHHWWKPKDRRTNLVRAGALILAEIERLDRQEPR